MFWCHKFHDINTKIKEEMQREDKEISLSELLQILPVAVPVPKAACHFSGIRSRFSELFFYLRWKAPSYFFAVDSKIFMLKGSAISKTEVIENYKQSCFLEKKKAEVV